jgi:hypothetical protein
VDVLEFVEALGLVEEVVASGVDVLALVVALGLVEKVVASDVVVLRRYVVVADLRVVEAHQMLPPFPPNPMPPQAPGHPHQMPPPLPPNPMPPQTPGHPHLHLPPPTLGPPLHAGLPPTLKHELPPSGLFGSQGKQSYSDSIVTPSMVRLCLHSSMVSALVYPS